MRQPKRPGAQASPEPPPYRLVAQRLMLPEAEKQARAKAFALLLLGLYGSAQMPHAFATSLFAAACMAPILLAYAVHRHAGHALYWTVVTCVNPLGYGALRAAHVGPPWEAIAAPQGYMVAAIFYGITRLMGFGGRYPMAAGSKQDLEMRP